MKIILFSTQWNDTIITGLGTCTLKHLELLKEKNEVVTAGSSKNCDYYINKKFDILKIFKLLKKEKPNVIFVESLQTISSELFVIIGRQMGIKTCVVSHGISLIPYNLNSLYLIKIILNVLYFPFLVITLLCTDYFMTLSKSFNYHRFLDAKIFNFFKENKLVSYNNFSKFEKKDKKIIRNTFGRYILSIGYLNSLKNQIDQIKLITNLDKSIKLIIIYSYYDKDYLRKIKKMIQKEKNNRIILFHQNDINLISMISNCEFIVNTSKTEVMPLTLIEGISLKKTFLSYDVGIIKMIKGGIVNRSFHELLHNSNILLNNNDLKKKFEDIAFKYYENNFSCKKLKLTLDEVLNKIKNN